MNKVDINWLYAKGWTVRQAAKAVNRSYSHVAYVLRGQRQSNALLLQLKRLPQRTLSFREKILVSGSEPHDKHS